MAIDYREYARLYGGGGANQAAGEVGAAIGRGFQAIPNVRDRLAIGEEEALDSAIRPLISLMGKNVDDWEDIGNIPTAFEAFTNWKNNLAKNPRQARIARRSGLLNPVVFAQKYNAQMDMVLPAIKNKLLEYQTMNRKTPKQMREFFVGKEGLNRFLLGNTPPEELATQYEYLTPDQTWAQWAEQKGGALGIGGKLAGAGFIGGFGATGMTGLRGGANLYERFKSPTGLSKKDMVALESAAKKTGFGELSAKRSQAVKTKSVGKAKSVLTKAKKKYKTAEKAYKGKKFSSTKIKGPLGNQSAEALKNSINTAKANLSAANKTPVKNVKDVLNRAIKKHGKGKVIKMMAQKLGTRGAIGLLAKTGLAVVPTGWGNIIGAGLLATDIAAIYGILSDLAE